MPEEHANKSATVVDSKETKLNYDFMALRRIRSSHLPLNEVGMTYREMPE
jgi:hypothetical protein